MKRAAAGGPARAERSEHGGVDAMFSEIRPGAGPDLCPFPRNSCPGSIDPKKSGNINLFIIKTPGVRTPS